MSKIVAVGHDETGSISAYQLDNGRILNRAEAVKEAEQGNIEGVAAFTTRDGDMSIRSNRGQENYSLEGLPEITQAK